jgi:hypothetical protein
VVVVRASRECSSLGEIMVSLRETSDSSKCVWFIWRILICPREYLVIQFAILKYGGESAQKSSLP